MRTTKRLTLSAMLVALGVVLMLFGALFEVVDLSLAALASLLLVFAMIEIGMPYPWLIWLSTSLIMFLLFPGKTVWIMYFSFGVYPILKAYIERLPRGFWIILKLVYLNAILVALYFLVELIFGIPMLEGAVWLQVLMYLLMNVAFLAYDRLITISVRIYFERLRHRFKKFLK